LGSLVAPGVGTAIGSKLGSMASGLFEVELEALPGEQAEFEVARRLVGLSAAAARAAATARPQRAVSPHTLARAAVAPAARRYAPGLRRTLVQSLRTSLRPGAGAPLLRRAAATPRPAYGPAYGPGYGATYGPAYRRWRRRPYYRPPMYVPAPGYP